MIQDATIYQGDSKRIIVTVYTDEALAQLKNLTSATAEYRLGKKAADKIVLRITSTPNSNGSFVAILDANAGTIQITLKEGDTQALPARRYQHQVIITDSSGRPNVVTDGYLIVKETLPAV